jgi:hypothetical protein
LVPAHEVISTGYTNPLKAELICAHEVALIYSAITVIIKRVAALLARLNSGGVTHKLPKQAVTAIEGFTRTLAYTHRAHFVGALNLLVNLTITIIIDVIAGLGGALAGHSVAKDLPALPIAIQRALAHAQALTNATALAYAR